MAGLDPAIHAPPRAVPFAADARVEPGHDALDVASVMICSLNLTVSLGQPVSSCRLVCRSNSVDREASHRSCRRLRVDGKTNRNRSPERSRTAHEILPCKQNETRTYWI
jgi:hypothetical protein